MKVALMAARPPEICFDFLGRYRRLLHDRGVEIAVVIVDDNMAKQRSPLKHAVRIARRQARQAGCSTTLGFLRLLFYKALLLLCGGDPAIGRRPLPADIPEVHVPTLNSEEAVRAVRTRQCDLVCLMGTRIISAGTLRSLGAPLINVHSSDPRFVRGGPMIVWEVLAGLEAITLTIHEVVKEVDAGRILVQGLCPITFAGGIGATTARTMECARPMISALFFEALVALKDGSAKPQPFAPGPLRVTPGLVEALRAEVRCRLRSRRAAAGRN